MWITGHGGRMIGMQPKTLLRIGVAWTLAFAVAHVYWAAGGRVGVPPSSALISHRPAFLAYDLVSATVLIAAAGVARSLAAAPTATLLRLTVVGAAVALVRGLVGLGQDAVSMLGGHAITVGMSYDVWFAAAGVLFLVIARQATGTTSSTSSRSPVAPARTPRLPSTTT